MADDDRDMHFGFGGTNTRRKKPSVVGNIACCFGGPRHHRRASLDDSFSSAWFKSKSGELPAAEAKPSCRHHGFFSSRAGRRHRRHSSADFSYDPLSYALNFDDDMGASPSESDGPATGFSARLPLSPQPAFGRHQLLPSAAARASDLRRGFEAMSVGVEEMRSVGGQRTVRNNNNSSKSDEEVASPVQVSPSKGILVQLC